jgi:hypothetical protein
MIINITNISVSERAWPVLRKEINSFRPRHAGEVFALYYISSFTNADGSTVAGFHPGYEAGSLSPTGLKAQWALAHLSDGSKFYFMPKFIWRAQESYVVDLASEKFALFSVGASRPVD